MKRGWSVSVILVLAVLALVVEAQAGQVPPGQPFQALQDQIDILKAQVNAQQSTITTLQSNLAAAQAAISTLQTALNAETTARQAADSQLQANLNAERQARQDGDGQLQGQIDTLQAQVADLQNQIDAGPPQVTARVFNSRFVRGIPTNSETILTFDSERWDTADLHEPGGSALRAPVDGTYMIVANVAWTFNTGGRSVAVGLVLNGTSKIAVVHGAPNNVDGNATAMSVSTIWQLRQGETVEVFVAQNSGGGETKDTDFSVHRC